MTSSITKMTFNIAIATGLTLWAPVAATAQNLNITCDTSAGGSSTATDLCNDADMDAVESVVNIHNDRISAAIATNVNQQGEIDDNADDITDNTALINNNADAQDMRDDDQDQALTDAINAQTQALSDAVDAQVMIDDAQDVLISENEADIAVLDGRVNTNETNIMANANAITTNAGNIATNSADIATNAGNIAANSADIVDLQDGLSDLRTDMNRGLAMANAMDVFAPDQGSQFMLNVGTGFHDGEAAFGITGSGRVGATGSTIVYFGLAGAQGTTGGKAGVAFQW